MSSCLILQDKNNFYIGADTACSVNINGKYYRYSDNIEKIFTHGNDIYFCSGNMTIVNSVNLWIATRFCDQKYIDIKLLSDLLKKYYPKSDSSIFDIEILICRIENNVPKIYQISQYNNYDFVIYTPKDNGINIICSGYKTKELYNLSRQVLSQGCIHIKDLYSILFNSIYDNVVGGNIIVYQNTNKIICEKIQEKNIEYADIDCNNLHLLLAQAVIAGVVEGSSIVGGTIRIGLQPDGTYAFEVHEDGSVTMNGGSSINGYVKEEDINDLNNKVQEVQDKIEDINSSKMYTVEITTTDSTTISTAADQATLTCKVYSWDSDITDTLNASLFNWKRVSSDTDSDIIWNAMPEHQGIKSITIDADDVIDNSSFTCEVDLPD